MILVYRTLFFTSAVFDPFVALERYTNEHNPLVSFVKRYRRGFEVNEETLAVDLVKSVGIAGSFLDQMHTAEHFRDELFMPSLLFRDRRAIWKERGSKSLDLRAEEVAADLMSNEVDNGLSSEQTSELDRIVERFVKSVKGS